MYIQLDLFVCDDVNHDHIQIMYIQLDFLKGLMLELLYLGLINISVEYILSLLQSEKLLLYNERI